MKFSSMLIVIARRRSAARLLFLFSVLLTMLHICLCFLGGQPLLRSQVPVVQPHGPSSSQHNSFHLLGTAMSRSSTSTCMTYRDQNNQSDNINSSGRQQQDHQVVQDPTINADSSDTSKSFLEPLDVLLSRARKRPISPFLKVQTFFNARIISRVLPWLTFGDALFCLVAISIGAKGFALGLFLGKWTAKSLLALLPVTTRQKLPPMLLQLYPVLLAILLDILIS